MSVSKRRSLFTGPKEISGRKHGREEVASRPTIYSPQIMCTFNEY